jgi:iron complex transport system substrate-binding protein
MIRKFLRLRILGLVHAAFLILITVTLDSCQSDRSDQKEEVLQSEEKNFYSEKVEIKHARGFNITYFNHYKVVSIINPFEKSADTLKYLLLERGTPRPKGFADAQTIEIPLRNISLTSSMHVGLLEWLGSADIIAGLSGMQYVFSPEVRKLIAAGKVTEIGREQGLNEEKLITMHPDLIMTTGGAGAKIDHYTVLRQAEIPVMINSEWVETTPLARTEWVKLIAALLNKEKLANEKFSDLETEYRKLVMLANQSTDKPSIISGVNTKDAWFLPNGDSYMAQFFRDAGGHYHWNDTKKTGSLPLNFEAVYPVALTADFWLNVGFTSKDTRKDILAQDTRYGDFKSYKSGKMYSYNNRVNEQGSNDFFESGTMNPHIVLSDLIKILHPELLPAHQLVYYKQLK